VPDFKDQDDVERWLRGKPQNVAVVFAVRAALRTVPAFARTRDRDREKILEVFRSLNAAWAIAAFPGIRTRLLEAAVASLTGGVTSEVQRAAENAAGAAAGAQSDAAAVDYTIQTVKHVLDVAGERGRQSWQQMLLALSKDAEVLDAGYDPVTLAHSQLWPDNKWDADDWVELSESLITSDRSWDVWTNWYMDRILGHASNQDFEIGRVLIPNEVWQSGENAVNSEIKLQAQALTTTSRGDVDQGTAAKLSSLSLDKVAVAGVRAVLRSVPLLTLTPGEFRSSFLSMLHAASLAWTSARYPSQIRNLVPLPGVFAAASGSRVRVVRASASALTASNPQALPSEEVVRAVLDGLSSLRAEAARADGRAAASVFDLSLSQDVSDLDGAAASDVAAIYLWPGSPPDWMGRRWDHLKQAMREDDNGWEVWIEWYEDRINGAKRPEGHDFAFVEAPSELWGGDGRELNAWMMRFS
jgi:hypothetical protein